MLSIIRQSLEKTNNIKRSTYLWNAINAGLSAAVCPVILIVMMRTNGAWDSGVFSIAFAVASLMIFIGQYGIRRFQSSDIHEKYAFREYHCMRLITCGGMMAASLIYCIWGAVFRDYSAQKFLIVYLVCALKCIQAYADVVHGHMQQKGRLDVAAKASAVRFLTEIVFFCAALIVTKDLLISTIVCIAASFACLMLTTVNASRNYCDTMRPSIAGDRFLRLLIDAFPLFVSLFLNMYISNAPKYAIDAYLTEEIQAYYNILFMPAFAIQLVAYFIFNPILTTYAQLWLSGRREDYRKLRRLISRQCYLLLGLTLLAIAVAFTIGIPVLGFIYHTDLSAYRMDLCVLMIGGGMMAYGVFFSTVITIIREQKYLLISYGVTSLAALLLSGFFVRNYEITGAVILYTVLMSVLAVMLFAVMIWKLHKGRPDPLKESPEEPEAAPAAPDAEEAE